MQLVERYAHHVWDSDKNRHFSFIIAHYQVMAETGVSPAEYVDLVEHCMVSLTSRLGKKVKALEIKDLKRAQCLFEDLS